jgi:uncharacterized membrane protein
MPSNEPQLTEGDTQFAGPAVTEEECASPSLSQSLLGALFITTGVLHFVSPKFYEAIIPESWPYKKEMVQVSGVAELAGGIGVLVPSTRRLAGKGLIALLLAVYPANINMAVNPDKYKRFPAWALWARLPLQFLAIGWVQRAALRRR